MSRRLLLLLGWTALLLVNALGTSAQAQPAACAQTLRIGDSRVPNDKLDSQSSISHVLDELMPALSEQGGLRFEDIKMPRARAFTELRAGRVDLVFMASRAAERESYARLAVLGRLKAALMVRRSLPERPTTREELLAAKMHVIYVRGQEFGARTAALTQELARQGRLEIVSDQLAAVRMVAAGRADAIIGLPAFFLPALADAGFPEAMALSAVDIADPVDEGVYAGRHLPEACWQRLQQAAAALRQSGAYRRMLDRHMPANQREAFLD